MKDATFPLHDLKAGENPLRHPALHGPGLIELVRDLFAGPQRPLRCIQVEVTSRCAARCIYCPHTTESRHWKSRHMEDSTFANLWPLLKATARVHLQGWGEPLLHPLFFEFVRVARLAGCLVSTTTCGQHMTEEIAEAIVKSGMDVVAFSLAGTDEESNSARAGTDFHQVCQAIQLLQEVRKKSSGVHLEVHLAYIMLADRLAAVARLPELMQELGVHAAVVSTLDYIAAPEHHALAINAADNESIAAARPLLREAARKAREDGRAFYYALPGPAPCNACREDIQHTLYVDAEGTLSPCIYVNVPVKDSLALPDAAPQSLVFGNANTQNPVDIWQSDAFAAFRAMHRNGDPQGLCQGCVKRFEILD